MKLTDSSFIFFYLFFVISFIWFDFLFISLSRSLVHSSICSFAPRIRSPSFRMHSKSGVQSVNFIHKLVQTHYGNSYVSVYMVVDSLKTQADPWWIECASVCMTANVSHHRHFFHIFFFIPFINETIGARCVQGAQRPHICTYTHTYICIHITK